MKPREDNGYYISALATGSKRKNPDLILPGGFIKGYVYRSDVVEVEEKKEGEKRLEKETDQEIKVNEEESICRDDMFSRLQ